MSSLSRIPLQVSKAGASLAGIGLLCLYILGTAQYAMQNIVLGAPSYTFTVGACLESGIVFFADLLLSIPLLVIFGAAKLKYVSWGAFYLVWLPIVEILAWCYAHKKGFARLRLAISLLLIATLLLLLSIWSVVNLVVCSSLNNLLLNPAINFALEIGPEVNFVELGLPDYVGLIRCAMFGEPEDLFFTVGKLSCLTIFFALLSLVYLRLVSRSIPKESGFIAVLMNRIQPFCKAIAVAYAILMIPWLAMYHSFVSSTALQKVDVSIEGLESLTSRFYLLIYGDYEDRYAFYNPTEQTIIISDKSKVHHIEISSTASIFEDRAAFRKGPYLGLEYSSGGDVSDISGVALELTSVEDFGPAYRAGLMPGDEILEIQGWGAREILENLPAVLASLPKDRAVKIVYLRDGVEMQGELVVMDRP